MPELETDVAAEAEPLRLSIDISVFLLASRLTTLMPLLIGCLVFIGGWVLGSRSLLSVLPNAATMKANTAVGLILAAGALLLEGGRRSLFTHRMAQLCTTLLTLIGGLTLVEYIAGTNLGIDQFLLTDPTSDEFTLPGRPSVTTATCFFLIGGALLLRNRRRTLLLSQCLALFVTMLSAASLIGYLYGIRNFIGIPFYTGVAVHTSAAILMLCASFLLSVPDQGLMRIVSSASMGGQMARWLLPAAVLIPLTLGWLRWRGQLAGYYGTAFGLALATTGDIAVLVFLIWLQGGRLNRMDLERIRALQELHESEKRLAAAHAEERFRLSFEEAPVGMALLNGDGIWLRVNRSLCGMTGYSEQELMALNHGITHPDDMPETQRLVKGMNSGEISSCRQEKRYNHKDGTVLHVLLNVSALSKDATAKARGFVAHMVDITKLKRAEDALRTSEERFRVALKNSPVVVFNQDHELRYTWINSPVLAWAEQDYLGHTDAEIVGEEQGARLTAIKRGVLRDGIGTRTETTVTFQGVTHYYDLTVEPLRDALGVVVGVTCAAADVTRLKQAAAERERLIGELQETLEQVKLLSGLLPICAGCKKIRDEQGSWQHLETYLRTHSEADFTHGMCEDCIKKFGWQGVRT